jgi:UPF0271 protein
MNPSEPTSKPRTAIDLNADLGEGFPNDRALLERISSTSICTGAYAGSPSVILSTLEAAKKQGVIVGAHPGYPDREEFGRRERESTADDVERLILEQVETLRLLANRAGVSIRFLKPHGALYNQAQRQTEIARGVVRAASRLEIPLLGQPRTLLASLAREAGLRYVAEGFPDRRYRPDGSLVPRSDPNALLHDLDEMAAQVERFLAQGIETLCIHGDDPSAVVNVERVRQVLDARGIAVEGFLTRDGD